MTLFGLRNRGPKDGKSHVDGLLDTIATKHERGIEYSIQSQTALATKRRCRKYSIGLALFSLAVIGINVRFRLVPMTPSVLLIMSYIFLPPFLLLLLMNMFYGWRARKYSRLHKDHIEEARKTFDHNFAKLGFEFDEYILRRQGKLVDPRSPSSSSSSASTAASSSTAGAKSPNVHATSSDVPPETPSTASSRMPLRTPQSAMRPRVAPTPSSRMDRVVSYLVGIDDSRILDAFCQSCGEFNGKVAADTKFACTFCGRLNRFEHGRFLVESTNNSPTVASSGAGAGNGASAGEEATRNMS
jgi:hypothetical protein